MSFRVRYSLDATYEYSRIAKLIRKLLLVEIYNVGPVVMLVFNQFPTIFPRKLFHVRDRVPSNNASMSGSISSTMNNFHSFKIL